MSELTPEDARDIAEEALYYAYSMVHGYRALHWLGVRKGGFNRLDHYRHIIEPEDDLNLEVQINVDTLYTLVPVDLRAEPYVLTVPEIEEDRYFSVHFSDLYMHNYAYLGTRTTGHKGGNYLIAGPDWSGELPPGITDSIPTETWITYFVIRILCRNKEDEGNVNAIQDRFVMQTLSSFLGEPDKPVPDIDWPWPSKEMLKGVPAFPYFNFLLTLAPPRDSERDLLAKFARIGLAAGKPFDLKQFPRDIRDAIEEGARVAVDKVRHKISNLSERKQGWYIMPRIRGDSDLLSGSPEKYFTRAVQAMIGIYGVDPEECTYYLARYDVNDQLIDGSKCNYRWRLPERLPINPRGFWSFTVYESSTEFIVPNEIKRYSVSDRTDLKPDADGGCTVYIQNKRPSEDKVSNWLPIASSEILVCLRLYLPEDFVCCGDYVPPGIERAGEA